MISIMLLCREHTGAELRSVWLSYNRPRKEIKKLISIYGETQAPLYQMRLQLLVHLDDIGIHLTIGKDKGGWIERGEIASVARDATGAKLPKLRKLLNALPGGFYTSVADVKTPANSFEKLDDLKMHLYRDDVANHYFLIGTRYRPDDRKLAVVLISNTVMQDF